MEAGCNSGSTTGCTGPAPGTHPTKFRGQNSRVKILKPQFRIQNFAAIFLGQKLRVNDRLAALARPKGPWPPCTSASISLICKISTLLLKYSPKARCTHAVRKWHISKRLKGAIFCTNPWFAAMTLWGGKEEDFPPHLGVGGPNLTQPTNECNRNQNNLHANNEHRPFWWVNFEYNSDLSIRRVQL